jgi:cold shock CspA family protein
LSSIRPIIGKVISFDARRGLGTITDRAGVEFDFHATALADGSRQVAPGTEVVFVVVAGDRGRYEAAGVTAATVAGPAR